MNRCILYIHFLHTVAQTDSSSMMYRLQAAAATSSATRQIRKLGYYKNMPCFRREESYTVRNLTKLCAPNKRAEFASPTELIGECSINVGFRQHKEQLMPFILHCQALILSQLQSAAKGTNVLSKYRSKAQDLVERMKYFVRVLGCDLLSLMLDL
jgi:hypothetical protein